MTAPRTEPPEVADTADPVEERRPPRRIYVVLPKDASDEEVVRLIRSAVAGDEAEP